PLPSPSADPLYSSQSSTLFGNGRCVYVAQQLPLPKLPPVPKNPALFKWKKQTPLKVDARPDQRRWKRKQPSEVHECVVFTLSLSLSHSLSSLTPTHSHTHKLTLTHTRTHKLNKIGRAH